MFNRDRKQLKKFQRIYSVSKNLAIKIAGNERKPRTCGGQAKHTPLIHTTSEDFQDLIF